MRCINFDIISDDLSEDSYATIRGFRFLREQQFFRDIEETYKNSKNPEQTPINYIIWADCGKHFRNQNVLGYLFNELKNLEIQGFNFFIF